METYIELCVKKSECVLAGMESMREHEKSEAYKCIPWRAGRVSGRPGHSSQALL